MPISQGALKRLSESLSKSALSDPLIRGINSSDPHMKYDLAGSGPKKLLKGPDFDSSIIRGLVSSLDLGNTFITMALLFVGLFSLLMPYWLVYIIHVENRFCNTFRCNFFKVNIIIIR
jgi:hypothetical protein